MERPSNWLWRFLLLHGFAPRAFALLETTGRRTGEQRRTPVGNGLTGNTFWLVASHGTQADYVRNLQANAAVRVRIGRQWRSGTAVVLPDDDPVARSRSLRFQWDAAIGRAMASAPSAIKTRHDVAGLGVGLYGDYGPAQLMYLERGYRPDGRGLAYRFTTVSPGATVPVDDDLNLMMTRALTSAVRGPGSGTGHGG
jgi:deazaflavin-dependent oxidoreductase (nitroreductase family)